MPLLYRPESRSDPYDASMENLRKARASERWHPPRPWRSKEETLTIKRFVLWWLTCRDSGRPSARSWARQLGISHVWLLKVVRRLKEDPGEVRRLQAYGDPTLEQLNRAQEYTRKMGEHGELRPRRRRADKGLGNRMKKAVLEHLVGQTHGSTARKIAMAVHVWPIRGIYPLLRRYQRLDLIRVRRPTWSALVWEITPHGRVRLEWLERQAR